jgi:hypothetical protein
MIQRAMRVVLDVVATIPDEVPEELREIVISNIRKL